MLLSRRKQYWTLVLSLVTVVIVWLFSAMGLFTRLDWADFDHRMHVFRDHAQLDPQVAVVLIDEPSLQAMDPLVGRYPWPRSVYADLIDYLAMGGARAVVFDILFTETEKERPAKAKETNSDDQRLAQATRDSGITYHAMQIVRENATDNNRSMLSAPMPALVRDRLAIKHAHGFPVIGNNNYSLPFDGLYQASKGIGVVGIDADPDGIYRRVRLFSTYRGAVYPSLAVAPLLDLLRPQAVTQQRDTLHLGEKSIPLDHSGKYLINMVGDARPYSISGIFASIEALRAGDVQHMLIPPDTFKDKIVFVGASAVGLADVKATAVANNTPGVLIHASVTSNILSNNFLRPIPGWIKWLVVWLFAAATLMTILGFNRLIYQITVPLLLAGAYAGWCYWQFSLNYVYPMVAPQVAIVVAILEAFAYLAFTEGRDRRRVRSMLSQYVSPAMLSEVLDNYQNQLQAEVGLQVHVSILFSDVRAFTSISEQLSAEQVVDLLNTHFSVMTEIIFEHQGTLDKYIGDAIMAFWGAPIPAADHAARAVATALHMHRQLAVVNQQLSEKGYPAIDIGVGINTGDVVLGNIGSVRMLDYTVIGDNVNLSSRLEGLTKHYGCPVIISEFTHQEIMAEIPCALVDLVQVKGRHKPVRIYWPLALPGDDAETLAQARILAQSITDAFECYLHQDWEKAHDAYESLGELPLARIFRSRCVEYMKQPPPPDWDGVFTLTSK